MSTSIIPGWISLDSIDTFLSRHSGPWGLASVHDYEEPALHRYSTVAPDHADEASVADILRLILFYACAVVMIWAALMPTYLAIEPQILAALKPFDDFWRKMCEELDDFVPLPVSALEIPGLDTSTAEDADDVLHDASEAPLPPSPSPLLPAGFTTIPMNMGFIANVLAQLRTMSKQDRDEMLQEQKTQFDIFMQEMSKMFKPAATTPTTATSPPVTAADVHGILEECRESTLADCQSAIQEQQTAFKDEVAKLIQDATAAPTTPALTTRDLDALAQRIQEQTIESCTTVFQGSLAGTKKDLLDEVKLANEAAHETCNTKAARLPVSESREMRRMKEENSLLRKDLLAAAKKQDALSSRVRVVGERQFTYSLRQNEFTRRILASQHQDHAKATKSHIEVATAAQIDHVQDLAAQAEKARQVKLQHQADLAAKDAAAGQLDAKHKLTIKNATAAYQKTKRQLDDIVAKQETASDLWKVEYREACAKAAEVKAKEVAKEVEERQAQAASDHARELQALRHQLAVEKERNDRLATDHERLQVYCTRLNEMASHHQPPPASPAH